MSETRKLAAILVADIVGYSRLAGADEDRILARLRTLRSDLIDPTIAVHHGRVVKRIGDGAIVEFRSVVDAVNCAVEIQNAMAERNVGAPEERRIVLRIGIHTGDVVEESDGDLMGDAVNIAARLEGVAKPGGIALSEDAYRQVKARLDLKVSDLGLTQLKNIAEPIRIYFLEIGVASGLSAPTQRQSLARSAKAREALRRRLAIATVVIIAVLSTGGYVWHSGLTPRTLGFSGDSSQTTSRHLSLVVLPFANLSGDPSQDYFADGVTDNLTTDLSRIPNSFVIARNTAFSYKNSAVFDVKEIGRELGVRYALEGSVQRDQTRVRVNVQLIDTASGAHLWAERFEEELADLFRLQDQVVARVANTLGNELVRAEAQKAALSKNPDAIDLAMRGREIQILWWSRPSQQTKANNESARALFEQALKGDPNDADALAGYAATYDFEWEWGWTNDATDYDAKILRQADRALTVDPGNVWACAVKVNFLQLTKRWDEAIRVADAGLAINPNSSLLLATRAKALNLAGRFEEAKADLQKALKLSPRDPQLGWWHEALGDAELGLGHFDAAAEEYKKDLELSDTTIGYLDLASAYALAGKTDEANAALSRARSLSPRVSISGLQKLAAISRWYDGLRKAGLPEQ